jgi:hypothetical protein
MTPRAAEGDMSRKLRVYITVDTETSMGGAWKNRNYTPLALDRPVFGKCGSGSYGIPLIMDILEKHGFRATFFTEVFCAHVLGREPVAAVLRYIRQRGHDAQLHLHPTYRFYSDFQRGLPRRETDLMFQLSREEQRQLIREGVTLFQELAGRAPRAYRAGCYGASEITLAALHENGVEIDSSYNLAYLGMTCGFETDSLNAPAVIRGVYEFPVTVFRVSGSSAYKPLEISAVSVSEIVASIHRMRAAGCQDVVLVLHSFSLLKNHGTRYENCVPDRIVIQRLRKLCTALAELKGEVEVAVLGELDLRSVPTPQAQFIPNLGWVRPAIRKAVQGINRLSWV